MRGDARHLGEHAKRVGMKCLVAGKAFNLDAQQILDRACYIVALAHFISRCHRLLERFGIFRKMSRQAHHHERSDLSAKPAAIKYSAVAFDKAASLELLNAAQTGRGRKADVICQIRIADSPIPLEAMQYSLVNLVHC